MKIDVSDLLLKSVGAELKISGSEDISFSKEDNLKLSSPVRVALKLVNTGRTVLVSGTLKANVYMECCRCLKEFELPLNIKIEEEYRKKVPVTRIQRAVNDEVELKEKDFIFEIGDDNIIDLGEAIRQNIIVSLPIKPLCKKTCKLMVPVIETKKTIDPRLEKLRSIKISGGN